MFNINISSDPLFFFYFYLDESHELLPKDHSINTPAIVIHTCDDWKNPDDINNSLRQKLIKPNLVQTKRPPRNDADEHM
jgi:hypothetical protein